jgi:hypothetical protein
VIEKNGVNIAPSRDGVSAETRACLGLHGVRGDQSNRRNRVSPILRVCRTSNADLETYLPLTHHIVC